MKTVLVLLVEHVLRPAWRRVTGECWTVEDARYRAEFLKQYQGG